VGTQGRGLRARLRADAVFGARPHGATRPSS
jgi:hypothetical protein